MTAAIRFANLCDCRRWILYPSYAFQFGNMDVVDPVSSWLVLLVSLVPEMKSALLQ